MRRIHPPSRWAAILVLATLAGVPSARAGDDTGDAHPTLRDFQATGQYVLWAKDEAVDQATIYYSEPSAAYLIVTEAFPDAVLILPRTRCVESVKSDEMIERDDGGIDVKKEAMPCGLGRFRLEGADVVFDVGDIPARLKPKPPLLGGHRRDALLEHSPEYARGAKAYKPDMDVIEQMKKANKKARIQIFFGSWCSFCARFVPHILRVEEELQGTDLSFEYFGLEPPPAAWVGETATKMGIKRLPTGIIFVDDKEIGRIIGTEWIRPEVALARFLR